jgi:hypothetical protein
MSNHFGNMPVENSVEIGEVARLLPRAPRRFLPSPSRTVPSTPYFHQDFSGYL